MWNGMVGKHYENIFLLLMIPTKNQNGRVKYKCRCSGVEPTSP
jgi:hypothetical protein